MINRVSSHALAFCDIAPFHMEHLRDDDNEEEEGESSPYGSQAYTVMSANDL